MSTSARRRRWAVWPLLPLLLAVFAAGCSSGSDDDPDTTAATATGGSVDLSSVTLRIGDQKATAVQALLDSAGALDGVPYRIEWSTFTSGPPQMEALAANAIDIGSVGDTPAVFAAASGADIRIAGAYREDPSGAAILVPKDSPIRTPADLRGRKIAYAQGSSAHYHLLAALTKAGLTFDDITPAILQPSDALAAFGKGDIDAWAIWDPYTAIAQQTANARVLVDGDGLVAGLSFQVARAKALDDPATSAAISDFLVRLAKARLWAIDNKDTWADRWAKETNISVDVARTAVARQDRRPVAVDATVIADVQKIADAFHGAKLIPTKVDAAKLTTDRYNAAVTATAPR
ncbi:sulfonate transport system substrate-binding protein [Parafrankia irregularis]|uniref:Putative aliphatic sulfonates-binding protein n=1 Tax=Parafrankia irregularis TaxID=795642 RepID=A0A0S4QLF8_9ACTN|nr:MULTISPECIES: ABC transporter substrate-binding protein [Parafrankia]MBE3201165.1 ABC transporter substrate-binding protein [Parafrankia sp. CH37]CUU56400.1 sulfonate transport system substrate-binding protein [Parafrankia irregularis]